MDLGGFNDNFWAVVAAMFALCLLFLAVVFIIYTEKDKGCLDSEVGRFVVRLLVYFGILLGQIMFIPIVYNLMGVFACVREIKYAGGSLEPFPFRDCTQTCWTGQHAIYAGLATVGLVIYVPLSTYTSLIWQMLHDSLLILEKPHYVAFVAIWKLVLCMVHAFFEPFSLAHATTVWVLVSALLFMTVFRRPSTSSYFDLLSITLHALLFWGALSVICGLFFPTWVTIIMTCVGAVLILVEFWLLNQSRLSQSVGQWAKGTIQHRRRIQKKENLKWLLKAEKRRRLKNVASRNNALYNADNPREVPPLHPDDQSGALEEGFVFRNRETGKMVTLLGMRQSARSAALSSKVLGLELRTAIPSRTPMSFHIRGNQPGTLLIMRSPDATLYNYLRLKVNGYVAFYNAHRKKLSKERPSNVSGDVAAEKYLVAIMGPSHDILPAAKAEEEYAPVELFTPVNNQYLVTILQNAGKDRRSFEGNLRHHAAALSEWIATHRASASYLGRHVCKTFKIDAYRPVKKEHVAGAQTHQYQQKIAELRLEMAKLDANYERQKQAVYAREFARGKTAGAQKRRRSRRR
jgi:hypothetical protein